MKIKLFVLALFLCSLANAKTYYVSLTGKDSNPGTLDKPWKTINKVNNKTFADGDTVLFKGSETFLGSVTPKTSGLTVGSYGGSRATINSGSSVGFNAYNIDRITVENLNFIGDATASNGIQFWNDLNTQLYDIIIDSCDVTGYLESGVIVGTSTTAGYTNVTMTYVEAYGNGAHGIQTYNDYALGKPNTNLLIDHCVVRNNDGIPTRTYTHTGNGIVVAGFDGAIVQYCEAYENGSLNAWSGGGPYGIWGWNVNNLIIQYCESYNNKTGSNADGGGFDLDGGCTNSIMQYNYSHDNWGAGYLICEYGSDGYTVDNVVRYNISYNDGKKNGYAGIYIWSPRTDGVENLDIYGNTILTSAGISGTPSAFRVYQAKTKNVRVFNNIFVADRTNGIVNCLLLNSGVTTNHVQFLGNDYYSFGGGLIIKYNTTYTSLVTWRNAKGQEVYDGIPTGMQADPKWETTGFKLSEESTLIGNGIDLSEFGIDMGGHDFYGDTLLAPFSIGAHNYELLPLAIKLLSFNGTQESDYVYLEWKVGEVVNHSHYEIERSYDGTKFNKIGTTEKLSFVDKEVNWSSYYRLVDVDRDDVRTPNRTIYVPFKSSSYTVYDIYGKYLGKFTALDMLPKNKLLIVNNRKMIIQ